MKSKGQTRFDLDMVRELAGGKTFARGEKYYGDGSVEILSLSPKRVMAQVAGTEDYRTILTGRGAEIGGECSCPAYADQGFCKHMVAAALAANGAPDGAEAESVSSVARIRDHLKSKGVDGLVNMVLELAEENHELFRKLEMDSALAGADDRTLEARLRKAIDAATRTGTYVDYREPAAVRALAFLETRLAGGKGADWHNRPGLLVEILTHEKKFDAAWSVVHKYGISVYAKQTLVEATDALYPREALEFYAAQVEQLASGGMYKEAVARISRMAKLQSPAEQATYSATLKIRHARKRNFMKLLK